MHLRNKGRKLEVSAVVFDDLMRQLSKAALCVTLDDVAEDAEGVLVARRDLPVRR